MREKISLAHIFDEVICLENLLSAWREFICGKRRRFDVQKFESRLMDNLISLRDDLATGNYCHGGYEAFNICDPKPRSIHKASVRDRLVHHAVCRILYPFFDRTFIADSYSCRLDKGAHKAINRFRRFVCIESKNNTRTCWILKGDIRKFFASVDHSVLKGILAGYIPDQNILDLLEKIIGSFNSKPGIGLPLGNLTSQLLANIYLNEFDQFIKHKLKTEYYIRYADDFVIMSPDRERSKDLIIPIKNFLKDRLKLTLHPDKVYIKTLSSGVDFLGWVNFFDHRVIRTKTKRRLLKRIAEHPTPETVNSYLGLLKRGNAFKIRQQAIGLVRPG